MLNDYLMDKMNYEIRFKCLSHEKTKKHGWWDNGCPIWFLRPQVHVNHQRDYDDTDPHRLSRLLTRFQTVEVSGREGPDGAMDFKTSIYEF